LRRSLAVIAFFVAVLSGFELSAQISASPYSVYGIGLIKDRTSAINRAMGGTGIALRDPLNLSNLNPAAYTSIQLSTQMTETGIFIETDRYRDADHSSTYASGNITNLNFWLRFNKRWAGSVGMSPFSTVHYNIQSSRLAGDNSSVEYEGTGGVSQFYFGNSFQITKNLSIGVTGSYLHGSIDRKETITSGLALGTQVNNQIYVNKGMLDFGLQYQFFLGESRSLTIGAVYTDKLRLNTSGRQAIYQQNDTLASTKNNIADYTLPRKAGAGISFQAKQSTFTADVSYQEWANAKLETGLQLRNTRRGSIGYQYRGDATGDSFWGSMIFRAGGYMQEDAIVLQKTPFNDWGFTLGIGIPVSGKRNTLNLSYGFNHTGTLEKNLIQQQSQIISLDLTFRDLWGIKRRFD
jgi:hypothetical protein